MSEIHFHLNLSAGEFLAYYRGVARDVVAKSVDGRTGRFPANVLRPFVTPDGVAGAFVLVYDEKNKFVEMRRVGD